MKTIKRLSLAFAVATLCSSFAMADTASAVDELEKSLGHASYLVDRAILHGRSQTEIAAAQEAIAEARYTADHGAARNDEAAVVAATETLVKGTAGLEEKTSAELKAKLWHFTPLAAVIAMWAAAGVIARRRKKARWATLMSEFADYVTFVNAATEKCTAMAKLEPALADLATGNELDELFYQRWHLGLNALMDRLRSANMMIEGMRSLAGLNDPFKRPTAAERAMFEDNFADTFFRTERTQATLKRELEWMERLYHLQLSLIETSKIIQAYRPIPEDLDTVLDGGLTPRELNTLADEAYTHLCLARMEYMGQALCEYEEAIADAKKAAELAEMLVPRRGQELIAVTVINAMASAAMTAGILEECWFSACDLQGEAMIRMGELGLKPDAAFNEAAEDLADIPHELAIAARQLVQRRHLAASGTLALVRGRLEEIRQEFDSVIERQAS